MRKWATVSVDLMFPRVGHLETSCLHGMPNRGSNSMSSPLTLGSETDEGVAEDKVFARTDIEPVTQGPKSSRLSTKATQSLYPSRGVLWGC